MLRRHPHPVAAFMAMEGLSSRALAGDLGMNANWVRQMVSKQRPAGARFRHACSVYFGMPESVLFRDMETPPAATAKSVGGERSSEGRKDALPDTTSPKGRACPG